MDLAALRKKVGYESEEWKASIASTYVKNLGRGNHLARAWGADLVAFFQPLVFYKPDLGPVESGIVGANAAMRPLVADLRSRVQQDLGPLRDREGVAVYDLSGIFDHVKGDVFVDIVHTGALGKEMVARSMADQLVARTSLGARPALPKAASGG